MKPKYKLTLNDELNTRQPTVDSCSEHNPDHNLGYMQFFAMCKKKTKNRHKQHFCFECKRWHFIDEVKTESK